eukprot:g63576.t1
MNFFKNIVLWAHEFFNIDWDEQDYDPATRLVVLTKPTPCSSGGGSSHTQGVAQSNNSAPSSEASVVTSLGGQYHRVWGRHHVRVLLTTSKDLKHFVLN